MDANLIIWLTISISILLCFSAFFSAAETAYSSIDKAIFEIDAQKGLKSAILIKKQYKTFGWTLATILISNNLVNVSASTMITYLFTNLMTNDVRATLLATFAITPLIVIFGEIFPKLLAKKHAYTYLKTVAYVIQLLNILLFPFTYPLSKMTLSSSITNTEKEIHDLLSIASNEGVLEKREATLASNALKLDSIQVKEILVPIKNVIVLDYETNNSKAIKIFSEHGLSRIPVKRNDKFIGVVILKDLLNKKGKVGEFVYEIPFISKNALINLAFEKMRKSKSHFAFVIQSKKTNKIVGIITIEDIIEELVGEIYDEHDVTEEVRAIGLHKFVANGSVQMNVVCKITGINFENSEDKTLKQWISKRINRKLKTKLKYTYKEKAKFVVASNKNKEETVFEINII